jgi:hypothetical protein
LFGKYGGVHGSVDQQDDDGGSGSVRGGGGGGGMWSSSTGNSPTRLNNIPNIEWVNGAPQRLNLANPMFYSSDENDSSTLAPNTEGSNFEGETLNHFDDIHYSQSADPFADPFQQSVDGRSSVHSYATAMAQVQPAAERNRIGITKFSYSPGYGSRSGLSDYSGGVYASFSDSNTSVGESLQYASDAVELPESFTIDEQPGSTRAASNKRTSIGRYATMVQTSTPNSSMGRDKTSSNTNNSDSSTKAKPAKMHLNVQAKVNTGLDRRARTKAMLAQVPVSTRFRASDVASNSPSSTADTDSINPTARAQRGPALAPAWKLALQEQLQSDKKARELHRSKVAAELARTKMSKEQQQEQYIQQQQQSIIAAAAAKVRRTSPKKSVRNKSPDKTKKRSTSAVPPSHRFRTYGNGTSPTRSTSATTATNASSKHRNSSAARWSVKQPTSILKTVKGKLERAGQGDADVASSMDNMRALSQKSKDPLERSGHLGTSFVSEMGMSNSPRRPQKYRTPSPAISDKFNGQFVTTDI